MHVRLVVVIQRRELVGEVIFKPSRGLPALGSQFSQVQRGLQDVSQHISKFLGYSWCRARVSSGAV